MFKSEWLMSSEQNSRIIKVTCDLLLLYTCVSYSFIVSMGFHNNLLTPIGICSFCSICLVSFHFIILSCFTDFSFCHCL